MQFSKRIERAKSFQEEKKSQVPSPKSECCFRLETWDLGLETWDLTFLREDAARLIRARRVDGGVALFDVAYDAFLIDDERGARAEAAFLVENAVIAHGRAFEIAQERESDLDVFGEARVGG